MTFYEEMVETADELLAEFGQTGTLRRPTNSGSSYNPTPGTPDDHACTFAVMQFDKGEIDGTRVLATDLKVYLAKDDLSIEPATTDLLLIGGVAHQIVPPVTPINPAGTAVYYELQVRK